MADQLGGLAASINQEPGFLWKVWTESEQNQEAGGIYLFETEETALAYSGQAYRAFKKSRC